MQLLLITLAVLVILTGEGVLWYLFSSKIADMTFPHEMDTSFFRFFTRGRMRTIAFLHTLVLAMVCTLSLMLLW